jgi:TolA-binding protein
VTTPATGATGAMSAATVVTPSAPSATPLGATIVTGPPATLGATVFAGPAASTNLGATVAAGMPAAVPAPAAAPRKGFPVALVLVLGFVFLVILGVGGWAAWKFLISKKADTGGGTGIVETSTGQSGSSTATSGAAGTQTGLPDSGDMSGFGTKTEDLIGEAQQYYAGGDYSRALETIERHLQNHKNDSGAYYFAAKICREMGKLEEARNYLLTALSYNPDNAEAHLELGKLYSNAGFSEKAVEQFREAARLAPDHQEAVWLLAKEFERLGDKENARKTAGVYVQNFPSGQFRAEADTMLAVRGKTAAGRTGTGAASGGDSAYAGGGTSEPPDPPPPPPPSPYVDVVLDGSALNLPGMVAGVDVMIGGASRKFGPGANMRLDNIEKGSQEYTVRVTYYNVNTNEQESTYSGSGTVDIRYPNQKLYVKRIGNRVVLQ